ncbi:MAG: helical backbone metal receptor [Campylobacter sp.]|nr:helical backbone metal receptor [Campylobacter sp.]
MKKILLFVLFFAFTLHAQTPKKLVILDPAVVEIVYKLGAQDQILAISNMKFSKIWPEEETVKLKSVGTYTKPNLEQIVELKPDLVITSHHSANVNEDIKKFKLNSLSLKAESLDDIYTNIAKVGELTDKNEKAKELINHIKSKVASLKNSEFQGKKIAILFSNNPMMAFSAKSLPGDIFTKLGFKNIADNLEGQSPIISTEFILEQNPDFIISLSGMGTDDSILAQNPVLKATTASKNGKVFAIPSSLLLRGTPRIDEGIDKIYQIISK